MPVSSTDLAPTATPNGLAIRDVLAAAWPLFQFSLPRCLPLAIIGAAASGTPGAEALASGEGRGFLHSAQWWGLYAASTVLMLVCYGGILRQQLAGAARERLPLLASLRDSLIGLPAALGVLVVTVAVMLPGLALAFFSLLPGLLLLAAGFAAVVWLFFAWPVQVAERLAPVAALKRSVQLVRGRFRAVAGVIGATLASVLVFVLLTGILMAVVMNLAGQDAQSSHGGLSFSRWLMAAVLSLPVVYVGAVSVVAYRAALSGAPANPARRVP